MSELVHVAALFNPLIHSKVIPILKDVQWETSVAQLLMDKLEKPYDADPAAITSLLAPIMIKSEMEVFMDLVVQYKQVETDRDVKVIVGELFEYYKKLVVKNSVPGNGDDINDFITAIKNIPDALVSNIKVSKLGELDPKDILNEDMGGEGKIIPSNFKLIRDATPFQGYLPGQVVQFVGAPATGKSACMLFEAIAAAKAGYQVLYVAMGDLMRIDFISRLTSCLSGIDYFQVAIHPDKYFTGNIKELAMNIDLITVASNQLSPVELREYLNVEATQYDLIVIDYDTNFQKSGDMYADGGMIYDELTAMARPEGQPAKVVFVASQPKIHTWNDEVLNEDCAAESSRKQQIIDMMVTLGKANSPKRIGIMHMAKVRRGNTGGQIPYMLDEFGRFHELTYEQYANLKSFGGRG